MPERFRRALAYANDFAMLVVQHVEEPTLASGVMNAGEIATRLGLPGIPAAAEVILLERDIRLVELTGARYHAAQISCRQSLEVMRRAKDRGLPVSCGVSVNHLVLNENDIGAYRTFFKLSPPLRGEEDRMALVEGVERRLDRRHRFQPRPPESPTPSACPSPRLNSGLSASKRCSPPHFASFTMAACRWSA